MSLEGPFIRTGRPFVLGHRGASAQAPENTAEAFSLALAQGADGVELDVFRCGSGELVVVHDDELSRLAGQPVQVERTPWSVLRGLDVGSWFHPRFASSRLLRLEEALELLSPPALVNVELKGEGFGDAKLPAAVCRLLAGASSPERFLVSSFNPLLLVRYRAAQARLERRRRSPLALLFDADEWPPRRHAALVPILGLSAVNPSRELCRARDVARWRARGLSVVAWTVDEPATALALQAAGIAGLITNYPAELASALGGG
ncbi:MAG: glycerophosphodiester phosphodiesterase [Deltaproteobacteria bacterium]